MSNVAGVNTSNSLRATDMFMKCQYMLEKYNGRGFVLATRTPISNSMSELYTLQRFLQPDELARMRLTSFDRWAFLPLEKSLMLLKLIQKALILE